MSNDEIKSTDIKFNSCLEGMKEWARLEEEINSVKEGLTILGGAVVSRCEEDKHLLTKSEIWEHIRPLDKVCEAVGISANFVRKMSEGTISRLSKPLSEDATLLLIEIAEVGLEILDPTRYEVDNRTQKFTRLGYTIGGGDTGKENLEPSEDMFGW